MLGNELIGEEDRLERDGPVAAIGQAFKGGIEIIGDKHIVARLAFKLHRTRHTS